MKRILIYLVCAAAALATRATDLTARADSAYLAAQYPLAVSLYRQAMAEEGVSPQLYYNLGNSYYRVDSLGLAMVYYQKALNLDPSMKDARLNINYLKTTIADRPEDDSTFLSNINLAVMRWFAPNTWAWIAFALFILLLACVWIYIFSDNVRLRKTGFFGGFIVLALTVYASVLAGSSASMLHSSHLAVVISPDAKLQSQPGSSAPGGQTLRLGEGNIIEIADSITVPGEAVSPVWYNVRLNNSTTAWINSSDVEKL